MFLVFPHTLNRICRIRESEYLLAERIDIVHLAADIGIPSKFDTPIAGLCIGRCHSINSKDLVLDAKAMGHQPITRPLYFSDDIRSLL